MGNFSNISFKDMNGWIPETDVDGVDLKESIASDISVFRFKNGFLENDLDTSVITLPTNVSSSITAGYTLMSSHKFSHSVQGAKTFYVLWKASAEDTDRLRMYIDNEVVQLGEGDTYSVLDTPNNINYNLVNDELKINLNCNATISDDPVILNLSLQYLDEVVYNLSKGIKRDAGWYIAPRWLGWTYSSNFREESNDTVEDFEDTSYQFSLALGDFTRATTKPYNGTYSAKYTPPSGAHGEKSMSISMTDPRVLTLYAYGRHRNIYVRNQTTGEVFTKDYDLSQELGDPWNSSTNWERLCFVIDESGTATYSIFISEWGAWMVGNAPITYIDNISYSQRTDVQSQDWAIIAVYRNGQRAIIDKGYDRESRVYINVNSIDWRIVKFEFYKKNELDIWVLGGSTTIDDNFGEYETDILYSDIIDDKTGSPTTLDFTYNLPISARVDNQSYIYSEVSHKGRVYFVKDDFKVYQSHIAGNGVIQPDSFPYDEDQGFGYFVVSRSSKNIALAVSPTNDLVVFTYNTFYVYQIQPSGSTVYRRLLLVSGSIGLISRGSLAKSEEGNPATNGLMWIDSNGMYYYPGGIEPPVNLLIPSHIEYWRDISNTIKSNAVGFYDATRQEYSLYMSDNTLLSFELPYKRFRKSEFSAISEVVGLEDNIQYFRNGNSLYKFVDNSYQVAYITSHYNSGYTQDQYGRSYKADEIDDKVLQELYVIFGSLTDQTANVTIQLFWDGHTYPTTFVVDTTKQYWKIPMPILRFRRVKIKLSVNDAKRVIVRDFGITSTEDTREALGVHS